MPVPHIDSYQFGKIVIDGSVYTKDVILLPAQIIRNWWRKEGHQLNVSDLEDVLTTNLQVLVVGQGASSKMQINPEVENAFKSAGIELISLSTRDACQEYNRRSAMERAAAALHLTC